MTSRFYLRETASVGRIFGLYSYIRVRLTFFPSPRFFFFIRLKIPPLSARLLAWTRIKKLRVYIFLRIISASARSSLLSGFRTLLSPFLSLSLSFFRSLRVAIYGTLPL